MRDRVPSGQVSVEREWSGSAGSLCYWYCCCYCLLSYSIAASSKLISQYVIFTLCVSKCPLQPTQGQGEGEGQVNEQCTARSALVWTLNWGITFLNHNMGISSISLLQEQQEQHLPVPQHSLQPAAIPFPTSHHSCAPTAPAANSAKSQICHSLLALLSTSSSRGRWENVPGKKESGAEGRNKEKKKLGGSKGGNKASLVSHHISYWTGPGLVPAAYSQCLFWKAWHHNFL